MLVDHINTIFHNLYRHDTSESQRFDMRATNNEIKVSDVPAFYTYVDQLGMDLLVKADNWLSEHQRDENTTEPCVRLGVGVYSIEGIDQSVVENNK